MPRTREAQDRHNELRRQSRGKARKAVFITDYFEVKYPEIFKEAEGLFNLLDTRYEDKYDLRKTNEFQCFKQIIEGKSNKNGKELYFDLETATVSVRKLESLTVETATCESLSDETATCESLSVETATCESLSDETATCESLPGQTAMECESLPPETATKQIEPILEIPLIPEQLAREATVTSQTIQIVTEQETPPVSIDDIPTDMIDEIISQLRQDPDLKSLFDDIQFQSEFDLLGEDLNLPELNPLQDEIFW